MAKTTNTTSWVPDWIEDPTKRSLKTIEDWLGSSDNYVYGSKEGEKLWTDFSKQQKDAIGNVSWLSNQNLGKMFNLDQAENMWNRYKSTPAPQLKGNFNVKGITGDFSGGQVGEPGSVSTERVVDENGWLGSIDSYMNPYLKQILDPQLRELREEDQRQRNDIGAQATMAGAFGDARHGIMEGEQSSRTNEAIADATGRTYATGYDTAMSQRTSDIGRRDAMETGNVNRDLEAALANLASYNEGQGRALTMEQSNLDARNQNANRRLERNTINLNSKNNRIDRLGTAATALEGLGDNLFNKFTSVNDALFNAGTLTQANKEKQRQAKEDYIKALSRKDYTSAIELLNIINGTSNFTKQSETEQESDDGFWGLLGSLGGSLFG